MFSVLTVLADVDVGDDTIEVKIEGRHRMNRAMEGDVVGIEIINDENEEEEEEEEEKGKGENDDGNSVSLAPIVNALEDKKASDASIDDIELKIVLVAAISFFDSVESESCENRKT